MGADLVIPSSKYWVSFFGSSAVVPGSSNVLIMGGHGGQPI